MTSLVSVGDAVFVGCGDGSVRLFENCKNGSPSKSLRERAHTRLVSDGVVRSPAITSLICENRNEKDISLLVGTSHCDLYRLRYHKPSSEFSKTLLQTSHASEIADVAFPKENNEIFATCGDEDLRVWHLGSCRELLRVVVSNLRCNRLLFSPKGDAIFSGWSDGKNGAIRVFRPQSGKLAYKRSDAHRLGVRSLAITENGELLISGGDDGTVRIWKLLEKRCDLVASMKEHKSSVTAIVVNDASGDEFTSCSEDGSCIIWDLITHHRRNSLFANTCFHSVAYHPDGSQLVTTGTDRKITYWDPFDGQAIRTLEGSQGDPIHALSIDAKGYSIVSGGGDATLRLWSYDEGYCYATGQGHSGAITRIAINKDAITVVSVGTEGGIFVWNYLPPPVDEAVPTKDN